MVRPSFIRTESDEITYCLHIILRYEIERDLINGTLSVDDAKAEWNRKFFTMFGIMPKTDNDGILQDTHWAIGAYGYFPCYAIGSIYASQLYMQMRKELALDKLVSNQDFAPIAKWLREKVHSKGRTLLADEIIKKACGKGLEPSVFVKYLNEKYSKIYSI
jgi:carboxypeptidase Taq